MFIDQSVPDNSFSFTHVRIGNRGAMLLFLVNPLNRGAVVDCFDALLSDRFIDFFVYIDFSYRPLSGDDSKHFIEARDPAKVPDLPDCG